MKVFLRSSFTYFNITQFLGALNDNVFRFLIVFLLIDIQGADRANVIMANVGAVFVIPFLLFSQASGTLADRLSKRNIIVIAKVFELIVMTLGILAFAFRSVPGSYLILFLMASQSALFGPSKYGIVPEIVHHDKLTRANGLLTSFTYLAIILGTFLASYLTDVTGRNFLLTGMFCSMVALIGTLTSLCIQYTPPAGSQSSFNPLFFKEIYNTLKMARTVKHLLTAIFGSAFFLFVGTYIQLNIVPFSMSALGLSDVQGGYLFLLSALGIGAGSMIAGRFAPRGLELGLVPIGGIGMIVGSFLIDYYATSLPMVVALVIIVGAFGGIYLVPLDTYIQMASPDAMRGQVIAASNFLSFIGALLSSTVVLVAGSILGIPPDRGFTLMAFITIFVILAIYSRIYEVFFDFLGFICAKKCFPSTIRVQKDADVGSLFCCERSSIALFFHARHHLQQPLLFVKQGHRSFPKWFEWCLGRVGIFYLNISAREGEWKEELSLLQSFVDDGGALLFLRDALKDKTAMRIKELFSNESFTEIFLDKAKGRRVLVLNPKIAFAQL